MDDIYGDLENYNDVNAVDELRNENKDLKVKLEEYATSIEKLQKDFDRVNSEFKKLEINYSSLLKTARAEIERKTQIINNLNAEKDMLVLSSIQNCNKGLLALRRNMAGERSNNRKAQNDETNPVKTSNKDVSDSKKHEPQRERNDENRQPSTDTVSSTNTDVSNKVEGMLGKLETYAKSIESKDSASKGKRALSLKQRRKSMPAAASSYQFPKLSSDEEYDSVEDSKKKDLPKDDKTRTQILQKIAETSGIDEKYSSYHESSRDTYYKGKSYRRPRERSRHRKHFSPERNRRTPRDVKEEQRQEFRRYRVLESPPKDTYDALHIFRSRRSNYERDSSNEDRHQQREFQDNRLKQEVKRKIDIRESNRTRPSSLETRHRQKGTYEGEKHAHRYEYPEDRYKRAKSQDIKQIKIDVSQEEKRQTKERDQSSGQEREQRSKLNEDQGQQDVYKEDKQKHQEKFRIEDIQRQRSNSRERFKKSCIEEVQRQRSNSHENYKKSGNLEDTHIEQDGKFYDNRHKRNLDRPAVVPSSENYEPSRKRFKIDSCSEPIYENSKTSQKPANIVEKISPELPDHFQDMSCQSPDDPFNEDSTNPTEIKITAATKLQDPRLTSKMYVKKIEGDKVVLTTNSAINTRIKPFDTSKWENYPKPSQKPKDLTDPMLHGIDMNIDNTKPKDFTDQMVHDIYMNIDNTTSNLSLESGEIQSESNDARMADYVTKNFYQDYENERINQLSAIDEFVPKKDIVIRNAGHEENKVDFLPTLNIVTEPSDNNRDERKLMPVKYKIPRISRPENTESTAPLNILLEKIKTACGVDSTMKSTAPKHDVNEIFGSDDDPTSHKYKDKDDKTKRPRQIRESRKMSANEIVAGDLELSDDPSDETNTKGPCTKDNVKEHRMSDQKSEPERKEKAVRKSNERCNETEYRRSTGDEERSVTKKEEVKQPCKIPVNSKTSKKSRSSEKEYKKSTTDNKIGIHKKDAMILPEAPSEKFSDVKVGKRIRKKSTKAKEDTSTKKDDKDIPKKETEDKKSKVTKDLKDKKPKFTDLFGDSSSLITPEDLGVAPEKHSESNKYIPIFEDAQDALDINIMGENNMVIEEPPVSCSNVKDGAVKEAPKSLICKINLPFSKQDAISAQTEVVNDVCSASQEITHNMDVSKVTEPNKSDNVKTVLISTGVQPHVDKTESVRPDNILENTEADNNVVKKSDIVRPMSFATSTPHKRLLLPLETEKDSSCYSSEGSFKDDTIDQSSTSNGPSNTEPKNDEPDFRVFVKRRRKLKK